MTSVRVSRCKRDLAERDGFERAAQRAETLGAFHSRCARSARACAARPRAPARACASTAFSRSPSVRSADSCCWPNVCRASCRNDFVVAAQGLAGDGVEAACAVVASPVSSDCSRSRCDVVGRLERRLAPSASSSSAACVRRAPEQPADQQADSAGRVPANTSDCRSSSLIRGGRR